MNRILQYSCLLGIGLLLCCSPAYAGNWAESWESIQRESAKVGSLQARFTQSKHMKILSKPLVSRGRFYFQAPNAVRWEYVSPIKSVLLMSAGGIRRYTSGSTGMVEDASGSIQSMQVVLKEIGNWSKGRFTEGDFFSARLEGGKAPRIILTPRQKGLAAFISEIVIALAPDKPGILQSIKIFENEGDFTLFEFSDIRLNLKIPEAVFQEAK